MFFLVSNCKTTFLFNKAIIEFGFRRLCVGNIVIVTQRAPPFVFVLDATVIIIMEVMIDILSLKNSTLILRFVISCYIH